MSYFLTQPVPQNWFNKVMILAILSNGMVHIKDPLLPIRERERERERESERARERERERPSSSSSRFFSLISFP